MSDAVLRPPLSKSDAQRALVLAELLGRPLDAVLAARPDGPVTDAPIAEALPADVDLLRSGLLAMRAPEADLDCRDGGTPFRFLLTQAALLPGHVTRFTGTPRLGARPHDALVEALERALGPAGLRIERGKPWPWLVCAPATVLPIEAFEVRGEDTSQAVSSLLLGAARLAQAHRQPVEVRVTGPLASAGYVELTLVWLHAAGFNVERDASSFTVQPASRLAALPPIPGDWSSIAPLLLIAWRTGARVERVPRDAAHPTPGASVFEATQREVELAPHPDRAIVPLLRTVGLTVAPVGSEVRVEGTLRGGLDVDVAQSPDLALALGALACVLPVPSTFRNAGILRHKESDRLEGLVSLARAGGASVEVKGDEVRVTPGPPPRAVAFGAQGDHRRAMAAACLAVLAGASLRLDDTACVAKSFPGFWDEVAKVGLRVDTTP